MGNGKSTTGNKLIRDILKQQKKKPKESQQFESKKSIKAVTTDIELKYFDKINYIDSPGFNDPDKFRSDEMIFQAIVETVLNKAACFGLSSVL